jgi:hypothetical protein
LPVQQLKPVMRSTAVSRRRSTPMCARFQSPKDSVATSLSTRLRRLPASRTHHRARARVRFAALGAASRRSHGGCRSWVVLWAATCRSTTAGRCRPLRDAAELNPLLIQKTQQPRQMLLSTLSISWSRTVFCVLVSGTTLSVLVAGTSLERG